MANDIEIACSYCGKKISAKDAKSYMDIAKEKEPTYFCSVDCAISKLFGIVRKTREFLIGLENGR